MIYKEILNFIYYNGITIGLGTTLFVLLEYISDRENITNNLKNKMLDIVSWSIDKIISINMLINPIKKKEISNIKFVIYTDSDGNTIKYKEKIIKNNESVMINEENNVSSENYKKYDLLLFDVKFAENNENIDMIKDIERFCIEGNSIDKDLILTLCKNMKNIEKISLMSDDFILKEITSDNFKICFANEDINIIYNEK